MTAKIETYLALLDRRLSLLRELAQQLVSSRKEFVALDLEGMYGRIAEQERLCNQIQALHPAIELLQKSCATQLNFKLAIESGNAEDAARAGRFRCVMRDLGKVQAEVSRLNQIHAAYLRRSGRTLNMLMNFLANQAFTYAPPAGAILPAPRTAEKG